MPGFPSRTTLSLCLALALTCVQTPALHAQDKTRTLTGSVTDTGHEPLRGAIVQLEDEATHSVISFITDRRGTYSFKRISSETDYKVWATFRGIKSRERELDKFNSKKNPEIDLMIDLH